MGGQEEQGPEITGLPDRDDWRRYGAADRSCVRLFRMWSKDYCWGRPGVLARPAPLRLRRTGLYSLRSPNRVLVFGLRRVSALPGDHPIAHPPGPGGPGLRRTDGLLVAAPLHAGRNRRRLPWGRNGQRGQLELVRGVPQW